MIGKFVIPLLAFVGHSDAYSLSGFTGTPVSLPSFPKVTRSNAGVRRDTMEAKGKPNVPINQRGNYVAQKKMQDKFSAMKPSGNGMPVFNLFVQTGLILPCRISRNEMLL